MDHDLTVFPKETFQYDDVDEADFLGAGAFGSVYRARMKDTGELVALKVLNTAARLRSRLVAVYVYAPGCIGLLRRVLLRASSDCTMCQSPDCSLIYCMLTSN